jgi:hypothetical protein
MLLTALFALPPATVLLGIAVWGVPQHRPATRLRSLLLRGVAATAAFASLVAAGMIHTAAEPSAPTHWEATVYLPLADNAGQSFPDETWNRALAGLVTPFGGGTLGEPQDGCWADAHGRLVRERVRPVVISFAPEEAETFRRAVGRARAELAQEAVYVRYGDVRVELIR